MTRLKVLEVAEEVAVEKGIKQGRLEGKLETARNCKQMGLPLNQIAAGTGLSIEQIKTVDCFLTFFLTASGIHPYHAMNRSFTRRSGDKPVGVFLYGIQCRFFYELYY